MLALIILYSHKRTLLLNLFDDNLTFGEKKTKTPEITAFYMSFPDRLKVDKSNKYYIIHGASNE